MKNDKRPITIDDLWSLKRFGPATVSPDGRFACAAVTSFSMEGNDSTSHLWLFATDGSGQRRLTHGPKDGDGRRRNEAERATLAAGTAP